MSAASMGEEPAGPALGRPVDPADMDGLLDGLEAGLSDPEVVAAQRARDTSSEAHRHAFTTWYASVPELAPVAEELSAQLRAPGHWVPYANTPTVLDRLTGAGLGAYVLPSGATPGSCRGLDVVERLARV